MRYVVARIKEQNRDMACRIYVTDILKSAYGANIRYADLISEDEVKEENPEEIKERLRKKLGDMDESV